METDERDELQEIVKRGVYPKRIKSAEHLQDVVWTSILAPHAPEVPPIPNEGLVACIGSCFAAEMSKSLLAQGKPVASVFLHERWNTAFSVRTFIEYALDQKPMPTGFVSADFDLQASALAQLGTASAFIITLGQSVCWFDLQSGQMVVDIKGGASTKYMAAALLTHAMRQTSVSENVEQIEAIIRCIQRLRPGAPIIFTLSPVPLLFSLTESASVVSNTISKATLRVALHEIMDRQFDNVFYWPSYEMVEWLGKNVRILWGQDGKDLRHLQPETVNAVMRSFSELYFAP